MYIASLFTGAGINLLLNLLLIPKYESVGAAIGTLAAEIAVCVVQATFVFNEANIGENIINSLPFVIAGLLMYITFHDYTVKSVSNEIIALMIKIVISGSFYIIVLGAILGGKRIFKNMTA